MIKTPRLTLRCFKETEAEILSDLFGNWEVGKWFWTPPHPYTPNIAAKYIKGVREAHVAGSFNHFAIALTESDELVGGISLDIDPAPEWRNEVSYWIGHPYWGRGYATETLTAVIGFAENVQNRPNLWAVPDRNNNATIRVLEKCGFDHREDIVRDQPSRTGSMEMSRYQIELAS